MDQVSAESAKDVDDLFGAGACVKIFGCGTPSFELFAELFDAIAPFLRSGMDERARRLSEKYSAARTANV